VIIPGVSLSHQPLLKRHLACWWDAW